MVRAIQIENKTELTASVRLANAIMHCFNRLEYNDFNQMIDHIQTPNSLDAFSCQTYGLAH